MSNVVFQDFSFKVKETMANNISIALEECAGEIESQAKRNTRVDTGKTKNSFRHIVVKNSFAAGGFEAYIGSTDENAIWEEFGTGEYALKGNGRKGGWWYPNTKAKYTKKGKLRKGQKAYIFTKGKKPSRALWNAFTEKKSKVINRIQKSLKGL